jgi:hypothetical protein
MTGVCTAYKKIIEKENNNLSHTATALLHLTFTDKPLFFRNKAM